jgi:microcompartment protein CcmK/EutM
MMLGRVAAKVTGSVQHPAYDGRPLFVVHPLRAGDGGERSGRGRSTHAVVAVDTVGAGLGDQVLVARVPGLARSLLGADRAPIRSLIVGILDGDPS